MKRGLNKRLLIVWLILSSMTLLYLWIDHSADHDGVLGPSSLVTVSAVIIASIKVRIIFREFMEVRQAPVALCRLTDVWVVIVAGTTLSAYFIGSTIAA